MVEVRVFDIGTGHQDIPLNTNCYFMKVNE